MVAFRTLSLSAIGAILSLVAVHAPSADAGIMLKKGQCDIKFDCPYGTATIKGKEYPIVCGQLTGKRLKDGAGKIDVKITPASGAWRPGLVRPGTLMIATVPPICNNCFLHVNRTGPGVKSFGCIGMSQQAFDELQTCGGSDFAINAGPTVVAGYYNKMKTQVAIKNTKTK